MPAIGQLKKSVKSLKSEKKIIIKNIDYLFEVYGFHDAIELLQAISNYLKLNQKPETIVYSDGRLMIHVQIKGWETVYEWEYIETDENIILEYFGSFS